MGLSPWRTAAPIAKALPPPSTSPTFATSKHNRTKHRRLAIYRCRTRYIGRYVVQVPTVAALALPRQVHCPCHVRMAAKAKRIWTARSTECRPRQRNPFRRRAFSCPQWRDQPAEHVLLGSFRRSASWNARISFKRASYLASCSFVNTLRHCALKFARIAFNTESCGARTAFMAQPCSNDNESSVARCCVVNPSSS